MADYPRPGSSDRTLRSHGEQIRRIRTRIPTDAGAEVYEVTNADCNNDGSNGWFIAGVPYPTFVKSGGIVTLNGSFELSNPYATRATIITIPGGFQPYSFARTFSGGFGFTDDRLWQIFLRSDGIMELASMHVSGTPHPDPAWGDATVGDLHTINIETSYPAPELALGAAPP